ncbi:MAG: hypothetical protein A3E94_01865 [Candidatus Zambryskibacteria bacterium RIFCSPHIGHO2_12_FULL_44_12b]|uniref:Uncharacterized protein n=1 Tax=Candidatus Zambryskibacteria bacterium RIFCSPLOWO2_01_FULL_45_21 TaxID=1802761 RepID=A0A1G2U2N5_9BACT|nr:MAG: hypothetical protein A3E94_01865 [Candidatus Zambryskibacteria bacterium RIFCSPHIGHO2_12_FULL_44_12b]OHB03062.1 MAG: hypothetical protein A3B14_00150 [Candidatus Zambryskibacteria bacterium RIFCSPLOWO2_01_FULL_45_21]
MNDVRRFFRRLSLKFRVAILGFLLAISSAMFAAWPGNPAWVRERTAWFFLAMGIVVVFFCGRISRWYRSVSNQDDDTPVD